MARLTSLLTLSTLLMSTLVMGCSARYRLADFTMVSSKNIEYTRRAGFKRGKKRVKGQDVQEFFSFAGFGRPVVLGSPKEAVDRAIESVPGAIALLDVVIDQIVTWEIYLIYGKGGFAAEGVPLIDPRLAVNPESSSSPDTEATAGEAGENPVGGELVIYDEVPSLWVADTAEGGASRAVGERDRAEEGPVAAASSSR